MGNHYKATPRAPKAVIMDKDRIESHHGPDKYPRLRNDIVKIKVSPVGGCWEWIGDPADDQHVRLYELLFDPLAKGFVLERVCMTEGCVCPFHMKAVKTIYHFDWTKAYHDLPPLAPVKDMPLPISKPNPVKAKPKMAPNYNIPSKEKREALRIKHAVPKPPEPVAPVEPTSKDDFTKMCFRGHPQIPANQYVYPNGIRKECLVCKRLRGSKRN